MREPQVGERWTLVGVGPVMTGTGTVIGKGALRYQVAVDGFTGWQAYGIDHFVECVGDIEEHNAA